jgi:hypothetical protein
MNIYVSLSILFICAAILMFWLAKILHDAIRVLKGEKEKSKN